MERYSAPRKKSQVVVEALLERLRSGEWTAGGRMPSEREISEEYAVSRTVVREALSALQLAGYIEARVGDGSYVLRSAPSEAEPKAATVQAGLSVVEALEAREAMDISAAHLAIENASDEDLNKPTYLVDAMEAVLARDDFRTYINLTLDLHIAMAALGGNSFIQQTVAYLVEQVRPSLWVVERNYSKEVARQSLEVHRAILRAVQSRDLDAAIKAVRAHYRSYPSLQHPHQP